MRAPQPVLAMLALALVLPAAGLGGPGLAAGGEVLAACSDGDAADTYQAATGLPAPWVCTEETGPGDPADHYITHLTPIPRTNQPPSMEVTFVPTSVSLDAILCVGEYRAIGGLECERTRPAGTPVVITSEQISESPVYISVTRVSGEGEYTLSLATDGWTSTLACQVPDVLPNDCFEEGVEVTSPATVWFDTTGTTVEPGERACDNLNGYLRSVWFQLTPEETGQYFAEVGGEPATFTAVAVYTGDALDDLTEIACKNWWNHVYENGATWFGEAGTTYHVQVATSEAPAEFRLRLNGGSGEACTSPHDPQPVNDCYSDAALLSSPSTTAWTLDGATVEQGEWTVPPYWYPATFPTGYPPTVGTLWYAITPEAPARYEFALEGTGHTSATVYKVLGPGSLAEARFQSFDHGVSGQDRITGWFVGEADTTYMIQAAQHFTPSLAVFGEPILPLEPPEYAQGALTMELIGEAPPCGVVPNDCLVDAEEIPLESLVTESNVGAGIETGEPLLCWGEPHQNHASVWYQYTPAQDQRLVADLIGSDFEFFLSVFEGSGFEGLEPANPGRPCIDHRDGHPDGTKGFTWEATAGTTYWIQVSGHNTGNVSLSLASANGECAPGTPANDCVADAVPVPVGESASGSNLGARAQADEYFFACDSIGLETVWYEVTPAEDGDLTADTFGSELDTVIAVYEDDAWRDAPIACNDNANATPQSSVTWTADAGTTYIIQVGGHDGTEGDFTLSVA